VHPRPTLTESTCLEAISSVRAVIRQHAVLSYYLLTFAISWIGILIVVGPGGFLTTTGDSPIFVAAGFASLLGPSVAGIVMTGIVDGRAGYRDLLSRLRHWRVGPGWYAFALLLAPVVNTAVLLTLSLSSPAFLPGIVTAEDKAPLLLMGLVAALTVPFFEELGWTGFATPKLLARTGVMATGIVMGVLWGIWHLPLFAGNTASSGAVPALVYLAVMLFGWLVPYRVLMVWAYHHTRSLLIPILMHATIVLGPYLLRGESATPEQSFIALVAFGGALWVVVAIVTLAGRRYLTDESSRAPRAVPT
jgi:membrane protease YdiL (CAAX protease family)